MDFNKHMKDRNFNIGDKIVVTIPGFGHIKNRKAVVVGNRCHDSWCVRVLFDGLKTPQTIAKTFCTLEEPAK